jgi:hypothetical protein
MYKNENQSSPYSLNFKSVFKVVILNCSKVVSVKPFKISKSNVINEKSFMRKFRTYGFNLSENIVVVLAI